MIRKVSLLFGECLHHSIWMNAFRERVQVVLFLLPTWMISAFALYNLWQQQRAAGCDCTRARRKSGPRDHLCKNIWWASAEADCFINKNYNTYTAPKVEGAEEVKEAEAVIENEEDLGYLKPNYPRFVCVKMKICSAHKAAIEEMKKMKAQKSGTDATWALTSSCVL